MDEAEVNSREVCHEFWFYSYKIRWMLISHDKRPSFMLQCQIVLAFNSILFKDFFSLPLRLYVSPMDHTI